MILDPVAKVFAVRAPDAPGPDRTGHGIIVFTTAKSAEDAFIQAPLCVDIRIRDAFAWNNACAYETKHVCTRMLANGKTRFTFEV